MDTQELYTNIIRSYRKNENKIVRYNIPWEELWKKFLPAIIKSNDTPDNCRWCIFSTYDRSYCYLLCVEKESDKTICASCNFTKYLLENI